MTSSYSPNGIGPDSSYQAWSEDAKRARGGWRQPAMSVALRYGLALVSVSVAFVLAHTFLYYGLPQPFTAFALFAIAGTFWYCGTKPGILAALISWRVRGLPLRTRSQRRISHSVWLGVPGFCIRDDPASCEGETTLKPESRSELRS